MGNFVCNFVPFYYATNTKGFDQCLNIYTEETWKTICINYENQLNYLNSDYRNLIRYFLGSVVETHIKKNGSIHLIENLRNYALLEDEVVIIGLLDKLEIWNPINLRYKMSSPLNGFSEFSKFSKSSKSSEMDENYFDIPLFKEFNSMKKMHLFLCHSSKDKKFAINLAFDLKNFGINVWIDKWEMKAGESLLNKIQEGIDDSAKFGIILTPDSVSSNWCNKELNQALSNELFENQTIVIPLLYKTCIIPGFLRDKLYIDLRKDNYKKGVRELMKAFAEFY